MIEILREPFRGSLISYVVLRKYYCLVLIWIRPVAANEVRQKAPKPKNIRAGNKNLALRPASSKRKRLINRQMIKSTKGKRAIDSFFCSSVRAGRIDAAIGKERLQQTMPLPIRIKPTKSVDCPY